MPFIASLPPSASRRFARPFERRSRAILGSAAALALSLLLGRIGGSPAPGLWTLPLPFARLELAGLAAVVCAGLLAFHFARLTVLPPRTGPAALAASLVPIALLPATGAAALLVPALVLFPSAVRAQVPRTTLLLIEAAAICTGLAMAGGGTILAAGAGAAMLAASWTALHAAADPAANDNPQMERNSGNSWLLPI